VSPAHALRRATRHVRLTDPSAAGSNGARCEAGGDLGEAETGGAPDRRRIAELPFEPTRGFHAVLGPTGQGLLLS
jgi:hypothetical protein